MPELIVVCGWCQTVLSPAPCEDGLASLNAELLQEPDSPLVSHTICPVCSERFLAGEAA
jgi:hypothetical protein